MLYDELPKGKVVRGPTGKVRSTIEQVEILPKREQARILDVVNALIAQATAHLANCGSGGGWRRANGNGYTGTKLETADTAKPEPTGYRASPRPY